MTTDSNLSPTQNDRLNYNRNLCVAIYYYLKNVWDRWLVGKAENTYDVSTFFDNDFIFMDSFYRNTYYRLPLNCQKVIDAYKGAATDKSLYSFIGDLCKDHDCWFMAVPDFIHFTGEDTTDGHNKEGFVSYFPTEYFNGGLFYFLSYMEIIMVILILINLLNAIYIEMFLRVYLTFKYAMKYIAALMIVLILVIMGYALGFNLLFGSYVEMFSTISMSFTSMMKFLFVDFHIMKDMMERYSVVATAFIISSFVILVLLNVFVTNIFKQRPLSLA